MQKIDFQIFHLTDVGEFQREDALAYFDEYGYVVFENAHIADLVQAVSNDIVTFASQGEFRTNSKFYHYENSPRIVEAWKDVPSVYELATMPMVRDVIEYLFRDEVTIFSTINFLSSTHQPLHADSIHFGCEPREGLGAAWFACEQVEPNAGPLHIVPGSHHLEPITYQTLGLRPARTLSESESIYREYEQAIREQVVETDSASLPLLLKPGQFVVWSADLIHGSPVAPAAGSTRNSMVLHFHCNSNSINFVPGFSDPAAGKYRKRMISEINEQAR